MIEKLFSTPAPLATFNSVDQFWYAAGKIVTNINHLELTGENLATNYVIQSLPLEYKKNC